MVSKNFRKNYVTFCDAIEELHKMWIRTDYDVNNETRRDEEIYDYFAEILNDMTEVEERECFLFYIIELWHNMDNADEQ